MRFPSLIILDMSNKCLKIRVLLHEYYKIVESAIKPTVFYKKVMFKTSEKAVYQAFVINCKEIVIYIYSFLGIMTWIRKRIVKIKLQFIKKGLFF